MNMIPKKRLAHRRGRTGFTLVEVIVVLVILAILAAIAIPALTGYIDRAQWKDMEFRTKMQMTAFTTLVNEIYARDGGFRLYDSGQAQEGDIFNIVAANPWTDPAGQGILLVGLTDYGRLEYEKLTGDTESFKSTNARPHVIVDASGAVRIYSYVYDLYFPDGERRHLICDYVPDINSADPIISGYVNLENTRLGGAKDMTNGFNILQHQSSFSPQAIKLN